MFVLTEAFFWVSENIHGIVNIWCEAPMLIGTPRRTTNLLFFSIEVRLWRSLNRGQILIIKTHGQRSKTSHIMKDIRICYSNSSINISSGSMSPSTPHIDINDPTFGISLLEGTFLYGIYLSTFFE